jgi:hypothetical protein
MRCGRGTEVFEKAGVVAIDEPRIWQKSRKPEGRLSGSGQCNLARVAAEIVSKSLLFEGRSCPHDEIEMEHGLKRDRDLLPSEVAARSLIDPSYRLLEPAIGYVVTPQCGRVAVGLHPAGIDDQPLR